VAQVAFAIDAAERIDVRVDLAGRAILDRIEMLEEVHDLERAAFLALNVILRAPERESDAREKDREADRDDPRRKEA
jgi:hypothetical protein